MPAPVEPNLEFAGNLRFGLVRRIGAGGIGLVYEAMDREYGTHVAVKTLQRLDGEALLRFKNEFRMLQGLHHPNLVRLGELFEEGGHWFFSMELLDGVDFMTYVAERDRDSGSLRGITGSGNQHDTVPYSKREALRYPSSQTDQDLLPRDSDTWLIRPSEPSTVALSPQTIQRMAAMQGEPENLSAGPLIGHVFDETRLRDSLRQLAEGLSALHRAGMVHRDIKPHNVMVCANRVVLLDFGLVSEERPWHRHDSEEGLVLGTPTYMAPEQAAGHAATPASDWYAVGTMLYQALTGRRPFEGQVGQILMEKQCREPVPPSRRVVDPETVPRDLEMLCMQLLQRDPTSRPTGAEVLDVLAGGVPEELQDNSASMPMLGTDTEIDLIGRVHELEALRGAFAACAPGHPMLALVSGISGMGKTALVEHFARTVRDQDDALVLRGRCYEREAVPYKAFDGTIDELSRYLSRLRLVLEGDPDDPDGTNAGNRASNRAGSRAGNGLGKDAPDDSDAATRVNTATVSHRASTSTLTGSKRHSDLGLGKELDPGLIHEARGLLAHEFAVLARLFPVLEGVFDASTGFGGGDETRSATGWTGVDRTDASRDGGSLAGDIRDPGELRRRAFAALKTLFGRMAAVRPLVVVIDDLQWGDPDSAMLLAELLSPPSAPNLLLVASYRREEARSPFMLSLREIVHRAVDPGAIVDIEVGPLSESDSRDLAMALWRRLGVRRRRTTTHVTVTRSDADSVTAEYVTSIGIRDCAGSPFFVGEMMRYLASLPDDAAPATPGRITLERVLRERRQQLMPVSRRLLDVVAVAGRPLAQGVALRAAGLDVAAIDALAALRAGHFVRTRGPGLADAVEVYHDRIREAVLAELDHDELRGHHGCLADALEGAGSDDAEMLAEHCLGAGRLERAAKHALQAAEYAERALAFDRAARMLRLVLDARTWLEPERRDLYIRLGEALANAGRGAEAVQAYLTAAAVATGSDAPSGVGIPALLPVLSANASFDVPLECRRRAAEQMFRSGSFDQGRQLLDALMRSVHVRVPETNLGALASLLLHRVWLRLRGLRYRPRPPELIPSRDRQRLELMWAGALAISAVDLVRGSDMATRSLLMALAQGDEARIASSLALEAGHVSSGGIPYIRRSVGLARRASAIARRSAEPAAHGLSMLAPGIIALLTGRWRLARTKLARAEEIFREQCIGAAWEAATAQMFRCLAMYYLGDWGVLGQEASTSIRHALERGDRYTAAVLDCIAPYGDLSANDVDGARRTIDQAAVHWQATSGYHLQHYLQLLTRIQIDLYAGEATAAWARMEAEWGLLRRSLMRRVQMTRVESTHMRARCALAMAALAPVQAGRYLRIARRASRALRRERAAWSMALGILVSAATMALRGRRERAIELLEEAEDQLEQAEMPLFAASAQRQRGLLVGGLEGRELIRLADVAMSDHGIVNPAAVAGMLVPGFPAP
jgi:serine/threonine protein kinase/tetratricopeptide (TPR) repeat protein